MQRLLVPALLAAGLCAQTYTAHPIDAAAAGATQPIPFGGGNPAHDEARTQFLIPAAFLPTVGGTLQAIELLADNGGTIHYERFEILVAHTTATSLATTFAANASNPQLVFQRSAGVIAWQQYWNQLWFDSPFVYDGQSNLVIEIRKKIDRANHPAVPMVAHEEMDLPRRNDLPPPIWASGTFGSGEVDAPVANTVHDTLLMSWLLWDFTPATAIASTRDVTGNPNRPFFHIGSTMSVATLGLPGDLFLQAIDLRLRTTGMPLAFAAGDLWLPAPTLFGLGIVDGLGRGTTSLALPLDARLVGLRAYVQSMTVNGGGITVTNAADAPITAY